MKSRTTAVEGKELEFPKLMVFKSRDFLINGIVLLITGENKDSYNCLAGTVVYVPEKGMYKLGEHYTTWSKSCLVDYDSEVILSN